MFLAPPWGGPSYKSIEKFTLDFLKPRDGYVVDAFNLLHKVQRGTFYEIMHGC